MELEPRAAGRALLVRLRGEFDIQQAELFREQVEAALRPHQRTLLVDLSRVSFIDSAGIGALLGRYKSLAERDGRVLLMSPTPRVRQLLERAGLTKVMSICDDEAEALEGVSGWR